MKKTALTIAGLALVLGGLAGCGSSDSGGGSEGGDSAGMPTTASTEEFCANFENLAADLAKLDPTADAASAITALQDAADQMASTGTPEGIPDDARRGLEVTLQAIEDLPEDATAEDISGMETSLSADDKADAKAFDTYLTSECGDLG